MIDKFNKFISGRFDRGISVDSKSFVTLCNLVNALSNKLNECIEEINRLEKEVENLHKM